MKQELERTLRYFFVIVAATLTTVMLLIRPAERQPVVEEVEVVEQQEVNIQMEETEFVRVTAPDCYHWQKEQEEIEKAIERYSITASEKGVEEANKEVVAAATQDVENNE